MTYRLLFYNHETRRMRQNREHKYTWGKPFQVKIPPSKPSNYYIIQKHVTLHFWSSHGDLHRAPF